MPRRACLLDVFKLTTRMLLVPSFRINKKGSQKDAEQKKSGNYFFYDDGEDDEEEEIDDFDL